MRVLVFVLLAFVVAGCASASHPKPSTAHPSPRLVRIVRHDGAVKASLTYRGSPRVTKPSLALWEHGHPVLRHRICPLDYGRNAACEFMTFAFARHAGTLSPAFRDVAPNRTPAF